MLWRRTRRRRVRANRRRHRAASLRDRKRAAAGCGAATWFLVGSIDTSVRTDYSRLLSLKVLLLFVMLSIAAFNRLRLTPRLVEEGGAVQHPALRQLRDNSLAEAALGLIILCLVGMLGRCHRR